MSRPTYIRYGLMGASAAGVLLAIGSGLMGGPVMAARVLAGTTLALLAVLLSWQR